jgi:hypothetical protein
MFLVRDIMYCKPGQVRPMVQKFLALSKLGERMGFGSMRVMTDVSSERYWTVVSEVEVKSLDEHSEMARKSMEMPEFQQAMAGYHDLVVEGRREIFKIET